MSGDDEANERETRCSVCHVPAWLNPVEDHENWLGHPWTPDPVTPQDQEN